ncbi:EamA family transporter [Rhizobium chutanense]|uniref:Transporter n=1 Tax=Rhizobium chutanense TaxID=2035448 RepID=A0A3S0SHZ9_9HYPH|nr:EamA family transporter [Rhizobium chutanense]RUM06546.1 transporter [Rhizobium chutanense]
MTSIRLTWLAVPVLNTLFQIFTKLGATQLGHAEGTIWLGDALTSHWILAAIVVEIVCFFIWMTVLAELDLSKAFPLSGISYVLIIAIGWFAFGEPIVSLQIVGSGLILAGIWLIAGASEKTGAVSDNDVGPILPHGHVSKDR